MEWYDLFSNIYDKSLEKLYFDSRVRAVDLLDIQSGQTVLDVACGTGATFKHFNNLKLEDVSIYGTDYSQGMLRRAKNSIERNNWDDIHLFQSDASELTVSYLHSKINDKVYFDRVICMLGLSVIPDWELAMDNMLGLLKKNGRIVIVDVFAEKRNFNTWFVEKIASANLNRKIWQTLETRTTSFDYEYLPVKESKVGGKLFVATGIKK